MYGGHPTRQLSLNIFAEDHQALPVSEKGRDYGLKEKSAVEQHKATVIIFTDKPLPPRLEALLESLDIKKAEDSWCAEPTEKLTRSEYQEYKKLVESLRGKWNKYRNLHLFGYNPQAAIEEVLAKRLLPAKNPYDYFPTPPPVIDELLLGVDLAQVDDSGKFIFPLADYDNDFWYRIKSGWNILDPSAGDGAILSATRDRYPEASYYAYEIDPFRRMVLKDKGFTVLGSDFLEAQTDIRFHNIIMNPPFTTQGDRKVYIEHIETAFKLLTPNGILSSVVPAGAFYRTLQRDRDFRNRVYARGSMWALPDEMGTFFNEEVLEQTVETIIHHEFKSIDRAVEDCEVIWQLLENNADFLHRARYIETSDEFYDFQRPEKLYDLVVKHLRVLRKEGHDIYYSENIVTEMRDRLRRHLR